jgi:hypothetical protein
MKKGLYFFVVFTLMLSLLYSCGDSGNKAVSESIDDSKRIMQEPDGTISLNLEKADRYSDMKDPSENTAEWDVVVSKSGRYNIWLSSATRDTTDLNYKNKVLISVHDTRIEGRPECDRIIKDAGEVSFPYYRAESFIGSMYIKDTGEYHIQVISEQILPEDDHKGDVSEEDISKLLSVSFKPVKR